MRRLAKTLYDAFRWFAWIVIAWIATKIVIGTAALIVVSLERGLWPSKTEVALVLAFVWPLAYWYSLWLSGAIAVLFALMTAHYLYVYRKG
jgi:hypothetical protein